MDIQTQCIQKHETAILYQKYFTCREKAARSGMVGLTFYLVSRDTGLLVVLKVPIDFQMVTLLFLKAIITSNWLLTPVAQRRPHGSEASA
ncbi:hypothetical protein ACE3NQ_16280 [Paenibacillus terreus]|uniref:Uncharacterized protein n=1 Tax=Paenibacillus terreus TaxID=1387834 RepID=A0ABV5BA44_9BACL